MSSSTGPQGRILELEAENRSLGQAILLLHRISGLVARPLELEPTWYALLTGVTAGQGLGLNRAMLFLIDETDRRHLKGAAAVGPASAEEANRVWKSIQAESPDLETLYQAGLERRAAPGPLDRQLVQNRVEVDGDSPIALALRRDAVVGAEGRDDLDGFLHLPTAVAAPVHGGGTLLGVLYGDNCFTGRQLPALHQRVFGLIADHAGSAIVRAHQYEQIALQAQTDALTGLGHHGTLMAELAHAVERAAARGLPLGLLMIDLDNFKKVNDSFGHLVGDALLAGLAARIRRTVRVGETPFRYGGDEFAVLLPGANLETALAVGERVRTAIAEEGFPVGTRLPVDVTCSIGAASLPEQASCAHDLVAAADAALLQAKRLGRNQVVEAAPGHSR